MTHTERLVKEALANTLNFSVAHIKLENHLREDLHLDSMSSLMFLMKLEESIDGFYVDPETLDAKDLETVSSVVHYVDTQILTKSENVH